MVWVKEESRLIHKVFGKGTFAGYDNGNILVDFDDVGRKKLSAQVILNGLLKSDKGVVKKKNEVDKKMPTIIQFDSSDIIMSGKNIVEASTYSVPLYFNESYVIVGAITAPRIYASYDLTIIGDVTADEIEVKGNLIVLGDIKIKKLQSDKKLICEGIVDADDLIVGSDAFAKAIKAQKFICGGNIIIQSTIDILDKIRSENMLVAVEGVIGQGEYSVINTVTGEYFDFDGTITGKVIDLGEEGFEYSSGAEISSNRKEADLEEMIDKFKAKVDSELKAVGEIDEDNLKKFTAKISAYDSLELNMWSKVLNAIIDISYQDRITNLRDYLIVFYASHILPQEIKTYETLEHVFSDMIQLAEKNIFELPYAARNTSELELSLRIITSYAEQLPMAEDQLLDAVFQSIGIKYNTVKNFLKRS